MEWGGGEGVEKWKVLRSGRWGCRVAEFGVRSWRSCGVGMLWSGVAGQGGEKWKLRLAGARVVDKKRKKD